MKKAHPLTTRRSFKVPRWEHVTSTSNTPLLSAEPDTYSRVLKATDKFIIFGSGGFWKLVTNEQAAEIVNSSPRNVYIYTYILFSLALLVTCFLSIIYVSIHMIFFVQGIAKRLATYSLQVGAEKRNRKYRDILQVSKGNFVSGRRSIFFQGARPDFHDDITVIVIYLDIRPNEGMGSEMSYIGQPPNTFQASFERQRSEKVVERQKPSAEDSCNFTFDQSHNLTVQHNFPRMNQFINSEIMSYIDHPNTFQPSFERRKSEMQQQPSVKDSCNFAYDQSYNLPVQPNFPNLDQLPLFMHRFFENVIDVKGDGHCGFRAVAGLLNLPVESHLIIRQELLSEVKSNRKSYLKLFGSQKRLDDIMDNLDFEGNNPALENKWMIMPEMGLIVAQKYETVVVLLTRYELSETFCCKY